VGWASISFYYGPGRPKITTDSPSHFRSFFLFPHQEKEPDDVMKHGTIVIRNRFTASLFTFLLLEIYEVLKKRRGKAEVAVPIQRDGW
jgi:hypothetical protein